MIPGDVVVLDGGEISLTNQIDGSEISLDAQIDGGEIGSTTVIAPALQDKTVTPADAEQVVTPDTSSGFYGLSSVTVEAIPSNYGRITWNGHVLTVS